MQVWHRCNVDGSEEREQLAGIVRVPLDLLPLTSNCPSEPAVLAKGIFSAALSNTNTWSEKHI